MPKESIRDKLDGNELDLSLNQLTVVPVKEMQTAALKRGTRVDLSCNLLTSLPEEFCDLTHIVRLDLSKNHLQSLPENIGQLHKLQHLDLFSNKIATLPLSFHKLTNLRWLDLRDNALSDQMKVIAGDCLNEAQCKQCAKNIIAYMTKMQEDVDEKELERLKREEQQERAQKANLEAREEKERLRRKAEKQAEKEKRKAEFLARQQEKIEQSKVEQSSDEELDLDETEFLHKPHRKSKGLSCCGVILTALLGLAVVLGLVMYYCDTHQTDPVCDDIRKSFYQYLHTIIDFKAKFIDKKS